MTTEYTDNFRLALPDFRMGPWHDLVNEDFVTIDQLIFNLYQGVDTQIWANNTPFNGGDVAVDSADGSFWVCCVSHTSPPTGTFAADRAANPGRWNRVLVGLSPRGEWAHSTNYLPNDLVTASPQGIIAVCITAHTSNASGTILDDSTKWSYLVDLSSSVMASNVTYNHSVSGTTKTNIQDTTDELYAFNASQQTAINGNTSNIATNTTNIASNTSNIAANTSSINTHTSQIAALTASALPEAPIDGNVYGRRNGAWSNTTTAYVARSGDIMTGLLTLSADPTSPLHAATKQYVDAHGGGAPSTANPLMDGTAAPGTSFAYSREDHVHPTDTSRAPLASPVFTGNPQAPTQSPGDNDTSIATTAFVTAAVSASGGVVPAALTRVNDTNVTVTLGGTPATALLQATSLTLGWNGTLALSRGGTAADLSATGGAGQYLRQITLGGAVSVATIPASDIASGAALTGVNDTNVTLTLGGTPATALLKATSITLGWNGTLAASRGGFGADVSGQSGVPLFTTGVAAFTATSGTGNFARVNGPVFTGDPQAPTATAGDNDTSIATTAFVTNAVNTAGTAYMKTAGNQTTTGGFNFTPFSNGTVSSGTFTPNPLNHNYQYYINGGAHTFGVPASDCAMDILIQNGTAPGAITFSGYRVGANIGDAYATANRFSVAATFTNASSTVTVTGHGSQVGDPVYFTTTGTLPTNFSPSTIYRVVSVLSANTITVSATVGGAAIVAGSAGTGTHTSFFTSQFIISVRRINGVSTYTIKALQ